jgi:hypothetical protein
VASLLQHRPAVLIVAVALAATAGVFTFARPQYHPPKCDGCGKVLHLSAPRPYDGWQWRDATPGFHFGERHNEWRVMSRVEPKDVPAGAGVLIALTERPHVTAAFWHDGSCVGVTFLDGSRQRLCNLHTPVVFLVHALPHTQQNWNMFVIGLARADVTRITAVERGVTITDMRSGTPVTSAMGPQLLFDAKTPPWWGSWEESTGQPVPWNATYQVYGRRGLLATAHVRFASPGETLYCASALRGVCGMSAHRRS